MSGERKGDGGYVIVKPTNSIIKAEQERKPETKTVWCLLGVMLIYLLLTCVYFIYKHTQKGAAKKMKGSVSFYTSFA